MTDISILDCVNQLSIRAASSAGVWGRERGGERGRERGSGRGREIGEGRRTDVEEGEEEERVAGIPETAWGIFSIIIHSLLTSSIISFRYSMYPTNKITKIDHTYN